MDVGRAICMLLGIPYHVSLLYSYGPWYFKAGDASILIDLFGRFTTIFRMSMFFVIAGFLSALVLSRRPLRQWLKGRTIVLLVPLFFGIALINPFIFVASDIAAGSFTTIWDSFVERLGSTTLLAAHLWFLATLFWVCCIFAVLKIAGWSQLAKALTEWRGFPAAGTILLVVWQVAVAGLNLPSTGLFGGGRLLQYLPYFLLGALLWDDRALHDAFVRVTPTCAVLALSGPVLFMMLSDGPALLVEAVKAFSALFVTRLLIGLVYRFAKADDIIVGKLVGWAFTIYLVHHPLALWIALPFRQVTLNPVIEFGTICVLTLVGSCAIAAFIERFSTARFMFNGILPTKPRPSNGR